MIHTYNVTFNNNTMYSPFDLNIRVVIQESADYIIKTLDITDDNGQADSDIKLTLDTIVVKVPTLPAESGDCNVEEP